MMTTEVAGGEVRTSTPAGAHCRHDRAHITDSRFYGDAYSTPASKRIFCDVCRMQRWLAVEAALALSQAEVGLIPDDAARRIAAAARIDQVDLDEVQRGIQRTAHSLVPLLTALEQACHGQAGQFVHYGATTQDIQDTGQALEMRDVLDEIDAELRDIIADLAKLATSHRSTLMIGRTHARPALPTTFGFKVAGWIDELLRNAERLSAMRPRVLVAQLHGGVGTMAGFDGRGPELVDRFARRLGLEVPRTSWHVARDRVAEFLATLAMLAATLGRIADEVRTLGRPEFAELTESWEYGKVGSSTMPHKRNPEAAEQVVMLARLVRANSILGFDGMLQEHERDSRGLRLEWVAVADASHHTLAALAILGPLLAGLEVNSARMAEQAQEAAEQICSESLMLALGRSLGKQRAHAFVYELSQQAQDEGWSLRQAIEQRDDVTANLDPGEMGRIFDPANYVGSASELVDQVVADAGHWLIKEAR